MHENTVLTLRQWRGLRGLSQEELARESSVNVRSIINYEADVKNLRSAKYSTIKNIADILEIKVDNIFLGDTSDFPKQEVK